MCGHFQDGAGLQQENKAAFRPELVWTVCSTAQSRLSYNTTTFKCPLTHMLLLCVCVCVCVCVCEREREIEREREA